MESWPRSAVPGSPPPMPSPWGGTGRAVFAVGIDHRVHCRWREDGDWGDWERLGGPVRGITPLRGRPWALTPRSVRGQLQPPDLPPVVGTQRLERLEDLAGEAGGQVITAPHGVSSGPGSPRSVRARHRPADLHKWWEGEVPSADWDPVGYDMISAPHAVSSGPGRMDIFAVGADNELKHRAWRKDAWAPDWEPRRKRLVDPACGGAGVRAARRVRGGGRPRALPAGVGRGLGPWRAVVPAGLAAHGKLAGHLAAARACWRLDRIDLFHVGEDAAVRHMAGDGEKWSDWAHLQGPAFSPVSVVLQGENQLELFVLGEDSAVWHRTCPSSTELGSSGRSAQQS